jgi:two-component system NtrC family sensor kinase
MVADLSLARRTVTEWSQTLEQRVVEKTDALRRAQHQVLHMEKMASLGKLSASVAHELNNPLAGMLTYARLVKREIHEQPLASEVRDELERYLSVVEQECRRCGEIVKNLLVFARRTDTRMAAIQLNPVVQRSLMLVQHHLAMRSVRLQTALLDHDDQMVADADQLQQALLALFVNAVEALDPVPPDQRVLSVRLRAGPDDLWIDVADTGVGIPADVLPHIFEPFFSTKQKESGVGLGLAVVYGIIHRHGGTIDVESQPGQGATFHLRLPRRPRTNGDGGLSAEQPLDQLAEPPASQLRRVEDPPRRGGPGHGLDEVPAGATPSDC